MVATTRQYDAVIIGSGFAGVVAARELGVRGCSVLVLEARDRMGGRTWFRNDLLRGYAIEMGGGWLGEQEQFAMAEVARYGIELTRDGVPPQRLIWASANGIRESFLPVPFEQLADLERVLNRFASAAARISPGRALSSQGLEELDIPLPEFFSDLDLPTESRDLLAGFWGGMASADWAEMSALSALQLQAAAGGTFFDYLNTVMLGPRFTHGTSSLIEAIFRDSGAELGLNEPVRSVSRERGRLTVRTGVREVTAGAVVCAVPLNVLGDIAFSPPLAEGKRRAAARGHSGRGFKLWIVARNVGGGVFSLGAPGAFNHLFTVEQHGDESLLCAFGPGAAPDPEDLGAVGRALSRYLPEAEVVAAASHDWRGDRFAKGTWLVCPAGFVSEFEAELLRPEGAIVFAGADFSEHRPGYIDGAVQSGIRAGDQVRELL
jgi:monoamine oxidase